MPTKETASHCSRNWKKKVGLDRSHFKETRNIYWQAGIVLERESQQEQQQNKLAEIAVIARDRNRLNRFINILRFTMDQ